MVQIYPTLPAGAATVPGMPSEYDDDGKPVGVEVTEERAVELMSYTPPAWTTNPDGSPNELHKAIDKAQHEQAWGEEEGAAVHDAAWANSTAASTPLEEMNVGQLRAAAKARDLPVGGKKAGLIARIQEYDAATAPAEPDSADEGESTEVDHS